MDLASRSPNREELIVEGCVVFLFRRHSTLRCSSIPFAHPPSPFRYLVKVQPLCTTNTTRWFSVTNKRFSYYKDEGGELYGCVAGRGLLPIFASSS